MSSPPRTRPSTPHRLREVVSARRRQLPPADVYPEDPWRIIERRFYPRLLPQTETIFCTSNGYLGIRATPEEGAPVHESGTYLNGFYETWPIAYAEEAYGFAKVGQSMLHAPDGTLLKLYVDDEPFELARAQLLEFERVLDFRTGTLDRKLHFGTPDGKRIAVRSRRLVSLENRHLACMLYEVRVLEGRASLVVSSELVIPDHGHNADDGDPRRGPMPDGPALAWTDQRTRDFRALLDFETRASHLRLNCAMDHTVEADCAFEVQEARCVEDRARVVVLAEAGAGEGVRIVKFLAYHHSDSVDAGELRFRAGRTLDRAVHEGFERVAADHRKRVNAFWEAADVEIEGDPDVQQAVRHNLFHVLQASARVEGFGIPAKGLSGPGYQGHYFWDTEIYVLPFLVHTAPHIARSLLHQRYLQLDLARRRAHEVSQKGAMYPWRTINGEEASAYYAAGTAQYHINADIVFAGDRYVWQTGDFEFLVDHLAEMAVETARLWVDLGFYSPQRGGKFCINGVTGPDEYNTVVNNNAYTNLMARENLWIAINAVERLQEQAPDAFARLLRRTKLDLQEVEDWRRAAEHMYIPFDTAAGVHLQDDEFLDREVWDLSTIPPGHFPLLLHYHPLVIYRHQVIKQADLVLATFLLNDHFTTEEKKRIFDYYDPLTTGDSSLSACIQSIMASELHYYEKAYGYFADAVAMDLGDIGGNVKHGLHVASLAGTWMALVYGFAGLRDYGGRLRFSPRLPEGWERLRFRLQIRDETLEVDVRPDEVHYRLVRGAGLDIWHDGTQMHVRPDEVLSLKNGSPG